MQLLVLALMLMLAGKNANVKELEPIIKELGGGRAAEAFKQAEELSGMLTAVQSLAKPQNAPPQKGENSGSAENTEHAPLGGYPLAPIAGIADERITYCLSRYIACGE
ncbi:MAG: hypothetical protein NC131_05350 [Roseburia sp.]|nr:hypothetical protein [Roseburia sp.]